MTLREISLTLPNKPGTLAGVARILARDRINLAAISVDSSGKKGSVRLVVSDPDRAVKLLEAAEFKVDDNEMLAVHLEDRAGSFLQVLDILAKEKVNVRNVVILIVRDGTRSLVALSTDNLAKTRKILEKAGLIAPGAEKLVSNADLLAASPAIPAESVGLLL